MASPVPTISRTLRGHFPKWPFWGAAVILALLGLGFLAFAIDLYLAETLDPPVAAAATAGLLILSALAIIGLSALVGWCSGGTAASSEAGREAASVSELAALAMGLGEALDLDLRSLVKPVSIAALLVGCAIGYSPELRRKLKDWTG